MPDKNRLSTALHESVTLDARLRYTHHDVLVPRNDPRPHVGEVRAQYVEEERRIRLSWWWWVEIQQNEAIEVESSIAAVNGFQGHGATVTWQAGRQTDKTGRRAERQDRQRKERA